MAGVAFALEHMHDRRVIYRDLKPEFLARSSSSGQQSAAVQLRD